MKKLAMQILSFTVTVLVVAHAQQFTVLYNFAGAPDGGVPEASLLYADGVSDNTNAVPVSTVYGTTTVGGTGLCTSEGWVTGCGTVFKVSGKKETVLYSFQGGTDGWAPLGGLVRDKKGNLYGTTASGGAYGYGTIFKLTGKTKTILYSFQGTPDGAYPTSTLAQDSEGNFYGTTYTGGANLAIDNPAGPGTVFKIDPSGNETLLYSFCSTANCADGQNPQAGAVIGTDGNLYGTTVLGGNSGEGTVFKLDMSGNEKVLYSFCPVLGDCTGGANPVGGLIMDADKNLYGTTDAGGTDQGVIFKLDTSGTETVLYTFCSEEPSCGGDPVAGLIMDAKGNLYGTAVAGGEGGEGTVFELAASGAFSVLHAFAGEPGAVEPTGGLVMDAKGNLLGTASQGGPGDCAPLYSGCGAVFKIKP